MAEFISGLDKVLRRTQRLARDAQNLEKPVEKSGEIMLRSIKKNFEVGGRPKWVPLKPTTLKRKKNKRILVESGELENSNQLTVSGNKAEAGTNLDRAKYPFHGTSRMPRRNAILYQQEDIRNIGNIFKQHIANGAIKS
jgi:phage gpG-like protein